MDDRPPVQYPRHTTCPKCGGQLDAVGWCATCAQKRATRVALLLGCLVPCLGFGVCSISILGSIDHTGSGSQSQFWGVVASVGVFAIPGGMIAGIIYWLVRKNRIAKGGP